MKKNYATIITVLCILTIIASVVAITLLNYSFPNTPKTPTPSTTISFVTPSNDPTQSTFHGVPMYSYQILQTYPHDPSAFTQGLTFDDNGNLIESTGLNGASSIRRVNLADGQVLQQFNLPHEYFGEGTTVVNDKIVQLTWQNKIGFIYDKKTFELLENFTLNTEGWGLTYDGNHLIMSDGTANLYFLDITTYQTINNIKVYDANGSVENLNELEYINGTIYANIWRSSKTAIINPNTGQIEAYIDLDDLSQQYTKKDSTAVLNGIAYSTQTKQLYVTGKNWSNLYEIQITWTK
ncbi:MAG: glutaminyl-peptide cyclotransferase [Nitrososphaerota archaeon]|jgi:glutamine cyclotransferase|nr:glutaminyl-peptide cyclotransferase [Nitrososphaerota archaeon]